MQIDSNILISYGATLRKVAKGEVIFQEGSLPHYYFQLVEGNVKLFSSNVEGKEIIQGVFGVGDSFGEPPLLLSKPYPCTAQATTPCVVIRIQKENLLAILKDYPEIATHLLFKFAERIYNKSQAVQVWIGHTPEEKITCFLKNLRDCNKSKSILEVPYTRQQIADYTGLRVETVIRTLSRMNNEGKVSIVNRKVFC